ncbi:ribonuclease P KNAG_0J00170 [Huiozyma naganishii CBS 8797]|uniref:Uncharacterized protein n=1 Tax=Huiozyma naganishii (strain ATCC MYA-139 / BCRC 22969 / CBS 8797 / KCTC 17520 / NBRC 10181 / NCYC 3082 / Yp74L-3) TaxID=1071383 RepID=J7RB45_HUIN7|nr:hypothetical protein KNAG_0J00170 [Kazachstania naganishii CBS 8797]CCK72100.1 hypothetical protein KNAG_0J00170 [Kazachstania naganishii CBS 8797]
MAFKSFKGKISYPKKAYHHRATNGCSPNSQHQGTHTGNGSTTPFFDSSYHQHLRQNHGLVQLEATANAAQNGNTSLSPHLVTGANTGYNVMDDMLYHGTVTPATQAAAAVAVDNIQPMSAAYCSLTAQQQFMWQRNGPSGTQISHNAVQGMDIAQHATNILRNNQAQSTRFYSTTTTTTNKPRTEKDLIDNTSPWEQDTETGLNKDTYLQTHLRQIDECYKTGDYNMINSLYQSLRRNDIVPPLQTYEIIFHSFNKRPFDDNNLNLNEKMFQLLNCYQDLLKNKLKPTTTIYNILLFQIFKNSIVAYEAKNNNGIDFFKIGKELINTVVKKNKLENTTINYYLLAMNLYATTSTTAQVPIPDLTSLKQKAIDLSPSYEKDSFYFISLVNLAKIKNDLAFTKTLYNEFLTSLPQEINTSLRDHQFEIYAVFVSSFIETGEVDLAVKIFDKVINEVRTKDGYSRNISLLVTHFLVSLSKVDCQKAYKLCEKFRDLPWVPTFTYEFYLLLMANSFHDWELTKKIYNYIYPMTRTFHNEQSRLSRNANLSTYLLYPQHTSNIVNMLMDYALQLRDSDVIMKLVEESIIKQFSFDSQLYPFIIQYFKQIEAPGGYLLRFIESHGKLQPNLNFLNSVVQFYQDSKVLLPIMEMDFFTKLCQSLEFNDETVANLGGLIQYMGFVRRSFHAIEKYPTLMKLQASLITKIFDFDILDPAMAEELNNGTTSAMVQQFAQFKKETVDHFTKLVTEYQQSNMDPNEIDPVVPQAAKLVGMETEKVDFFAHPGDWDKSYPLSLGDMIQHSSRAAIKEFENLSRQGYCFDYDTYKQLIRKKYINDSIIGKALRFHNDMDEMKSLRNLIIDKLSDTQLYKLIMEFDHRIFKESYLPYLNENSLIKMWNCTEAPEFLDLINFPENFKTISSQAENKNLVAKIYETFFQNKRFDAILNFNEICPVLDVEVLLKSCIRAGENAKFESLFSKFQLSLGGPVKVAEIQCEYLINRGRFEQALQQINDIDPAQRSEKLLDYRSFLAFLESFQKESSFFQNLPTSTLQFANHLSSFNSFSDMVTYYNYIMESRSTFQTNDSMQAKEEVASQILNNLLDSVSLLPKGQHTGEVYRGKLKAFYRFKTFLKLTDFKTDDVMKLIKIWTAVAPETTEAFFNNIVESLYLSPHTNVISLTYDLRWIFTSHELGKVLEEISHYFTLNKDTTKLKQMQELKEALAASGENETDAVMAFT